MKLQPLNVDRLNHIVTRTVSLVSQLKKSTRPISKAPDALRDILIAPEKSGFPELTGLYSHPVITPAGRLLIDAGFNKESGIYLSFPKNLNPFILEFPMSSSQARTTLDELFSDFMFQNNSGFAHTLAISLTAIMRPFIFGSVPAFGIIAPCPGTGKSLLTRLAITMVTGEVPPDFPLPNDDAEMRKKLTTALLQGIGFICIDNADGDISFNSLESFITTRQWSDRILGKNDYISIPNNTIVTLNGNNTVLTNALTRRTIPIFLDTSMEKPYNRDDFRHKDILNHVLKNQGKYLCALASMITAWIEAGSPLSLKTLGSFEDWSGKIGGILEVNGINGFMEDLDSFYNSTDIETNGWLALAAEWHKEYQSHPITPASIYCIAEKLSNDYAFSFLTPPSQRGRMSALGKELQSKKNRVFNGKKIVHYGQDGHTKKQLYCLHLVN